MTFEETYEKYKAWKNGAKIEHKIPALRQWYPTDNPTWVEDEEFRIAEPVHDNSELPEGLHWENNLMKNGVCENE